MKKSKMKEIRKQVRESELDTIAQKNRIDAMHYDIQHRVRREVLNELWAANKVNHQGHWYIKLADAINIIGDYNELEENESRP